MKTFLASVAVIAASVAAQSPTDKGVPVPSEFPLMGAVRSQGCWSKKGDWVLAPGSDPELEFVSSGSCTTYCNKKSGENYAVAALHGNECWCGDTYPPEDSIVEDQNCNYPCQGFDPEACGGIGRDDFYSVWNTGVEVDVPFLDEDTDGDDDSDDDSTTTPSDPSSPTDTSTTTGTPADSQQSSSDQGGGSNTVGIAVGVVVGIVLLALMCLGGYFYIRRKKQREEDEERRRAEAVNAFVGSKTGSVSGSGSISDARLDPVMAHRRLSDGSIADNEDYSRKILRVTNA